MVGNIGKEETGQDEGLDESAEAVSVKIPLLVTVCILDIILQLTCPAEPTSAS